MLKFFVSVFVFFISVSSLKAESVSSESASSIKSSIVKKETSFQAFTGKIVGTKVRMRIAPDLDSHIITELTKNDYVVVTGQKGDFYTVSPPTDLKAYIFRGFVIDDIVEGERVNIRLFPDREAPILATYSTGKPIRKSIICESNSKWLEISVPEHTRFYIAKEYIEYAGKPEMKATYDKRKKDVKELYESAQTLVQSEMRKPFQEMDGDRIIRSFETIIHDYPDFPSYVQKATQSLNHFQEDYLYRKIAFLEAKASHILKQKKANQTIEIKECSLASEQEVSSTDRMKIWEPIEEALYLTWSSMHHAKTIEDFYADQKLKAQTLSGILEAYSDPVKNKPGDFILKKNDLPLAYLYSTHVNLESHVGKRVTLILTPRSNNHFAFPAFYVLSIE